MTASTKLSKLIDAAYTLRTERLAAQREVDKLETREKEMTAEITELLAKAKLETAGGEVGTASFKRSVVPSLVNETAFLKWASEKPNRDVMSVKVSTEAWRLRVLAGEKVPGVESVPTARLSLTKA